MSALSWFRGRFAAPLHAKDAGDETSRNEVGIGAGGGTRYPIDAGRERQAAGFEARQVIEGELSEYNEPSE